MRYHVPDLTLGAALPPQSRLEEKFGGVPWGLPRGRWPICEFCGRPETFLAQFTHDPRRLDLLGAGRVLYLFRCESGMYRITCDSGPPGREPTAVFVVLPSEVADGPAEVPTEALSYPEARVHRWLRRRSTRLGALWFRVRERIGDDESSVDETIAARTTGIRFGGWPWWVQDDATPGPAARFLAQFDGSYSSWSARPPFEQQGGVRCRIDKKHRDGRVWWAPVWDPGDIGQYYLFLEPADPLPRFQMIRQCT